MAHCEDVFVCCQDATRIGTVLAPALPRRCAKCRRVLFHTKPLVWQLKHCWKWRAWVHCGANFLTTLGSWLMARLQVMQTDAPCKPPVMTVRGVQTGPRQPIPPPPTDTQGCQVHVYTRSLPSPCLSDVCRLCPPPVAAHPSVYRMLLLVVSATHISIL